MEDKIEQLKREFSAAINRLSMEHHFGDIPDFILANAAVNFLTTQANIIRATKAWNTQAADDCGLLYKEPCACIACNRGGEDE